MTAGLAHQERGLHGCPVESWPGWRWTGGTTGVQPAEPLLCGLRHSCLVVSEFPYEEGKEGVKEAECCFLIGLLFQSLFLEQITPVGTVEAIL